MCRWLAYSGEPIALTELIFNTEHSLIDQSLSARSSAETTNGDGFGIGWYDGSERPAIYKHIQPAWNDPNLKDLCTHTRSSLFIAHVRAATTTAVQRSNCHPFKHDPWLFAHNGSIRGYRELRRSLSLTVNEELYPEIEGTTDSEVMFYLALHFGMQDDVYEGVARMVGLVEALGREQGIEHPVQMTLGISDGKALYAFRYSSERDSRTLFHSKTMAGLRAIMPAETLGRLNELSDEARAIVSEPFSDLPGLWQEVPESSFLTIENGRVECRDFAPIPP